METKKTESAGGIVLNKRKWILVVNQRGTSWSLPKGHIEPGEEKLAAAMREIDEESGIKRLSYIKELGSYCRYKIGLDGRDDLSELKTIHMFLFQTDEHRINPSDPHNPEGRWVHPDDVEELLTHPKDKLFYKNVRNKLKTGSRSQSRGTA